VTEQPKLPLDLPVPPLGADKIASREAILTRLPHYGPEWAAAELEKALKARERQLKEMADVLCTLIRRADNSGLAVGSAMLNMTKWADEGLPFPVTWPRGLNGPSRALSEAEKKKK
jgi:hypothetical protein